MLDRNYIMAKYYFYNIYKKELITINYRLQFSIKIYFNYPSFILILGYFFVKVGPFSSKYSFAN